MFRQYAIFFICLFVSAAANAAALKLEVYNPGANSIFPVSSEIISGVHDAVLIDAQFQRNDAQELVKKIKDSGKRLTTVYISHSDPDYYFGVNVIHTAFPKAEIIASGPTVAAIKVFKDRKLAYWGPFLKSNAPKKLIVPGVLKGDRIELEGHAIDIEGLHGPSPARSYVWIPSLKTVVGGAVAFSGTHVWVADTQSPASRKAWLMTLNSIVQLKPVEVVPGHYLGAIPSGLGAVTFTADYLHTFEEKAKTTKDAQDLINAMEAAYPQLPERSWLELSAKVIKGDVRWPQ